MPKFTVLIIEDEKNYSDLCRKDPEKTGLPCTVCGLRERRTESDPFPMSRRNYFRPWSA